MKHVAYPFATYFYNYSRDVWCLRHQNGRPVYASTESAPNVNITIKGRDVVPVLLQAACGFRQATLFLNSKHPSVHTALAFRN